MNEFNLRKKNNAKNFQLILGGAQIMDSREPPTVDISNALVLLLFSECSFAFNRLNNNGLRFIPIKLSKNEANYEQ